MRFGGGTDNEESDIKSDRLLLCCIIRVCNVYKNAQKNVVDVNGGCRRVNEFSQSER